MTIKQNANNLLPQVRLVNDEHGELKAIAQDLVDALDYASVESMIRELEEELSPEHPVYQRWPEVQAHGIEEPTTVLNESAFFHAVLISMHKNAKPFKRFLCHEVLPEQRKYGEYEPEKHRLSDQEGERMELQRQQQDQQRQPWSSFNATPEEVRAKVEMNMEVFDEPRSEVLKAMKEGVDGAYRERGYTREDFITDDFSVMREKCQELIRKYEYSEENIAEWLYLLPFFRMDDIRDHFPFLYTDEVSSWGLDSRGRRRPVVEPVDEQVSVSGW